MFQASYDRLASKPQEVVDNTTSSYAIQAGPGSGKTEVLALKTVRLLDQSVHASQNVAVITYTNEMARSLRDRIQMLGGAEYENLYVGTVHGFCLEHVIIPYATLLQLDLALPFRITGEIESARLWYEITKDEQVVEEAKQHRTHIVNRGSEHWNGNSQSLVCLEYEDKLKSLKAIDFDGIALNAYWLIRDYPQLRAAIESKFPWVLIDEYQDLSHPFHELICLLLQTKINLVAVGDANQAIFAHSEENPIESLQRYAAKIDASRVVGREFDISYRCPENLLTVAGKIIGGHHMSSRAPHKTSTIRFQAGLFHKEATRIICDVRSQAETEEDSILVAHAWNQHINNTRNALANTLFNDYYFNIWSIVRKDKRELQYNPLVEWLHTVAYWCVYPPTRLVPDFADLFQSWLTMRGITPADFESAYIEQQRAEFFDHLTTLRMHTVCGSWLDDVFKRLRIDAIQENFRDTVDYKLAVEFLFGHDDSAKGLRNCQVREFARYNSASTSNLSLLTIHATKGLQFDHVIVVGIQETNDGWSFPHSDENAIRQKRLVYMVLTRARKSFHLISHSANLPPLLERVKHWSQHN